MTTNHKEWYKKWQLVKTSGTMSNNERQYVTVSDRE